MTTKLILTKRHKSEFRLAMFIEDRAGEKAHSGQMCITVSEKESAGYYTVAYHLNRKQARVLREWLELNVP